MTAAKVLQPSYKGSCCSPCCLLAASMLYLCCMLSSQGILLSWLLAWSVHREHKDIPCTQADQDTPRCRWSLTLLFVHAPLSPRDMRSSSSKYVVSSQPFAASGAVTGSRPKILNCLNCTSTLDGLVGVRSAVTELKNGAVSVFLPLPLGASAHHR